MATSPAATFLLSPSPFAVFRNRGFALLWTAQLISAIGSALTSLAASILVFRLTGSALSVGLMLMTTAAPSGATILRHGDTGDAALPRFAGVDQQSLRDLRTAQAEA